MNTTYFSEMPSPIGTLRLLGTERGLTGLFMEKHRHGPDEAEANGWIRNDTLLHLSRTQLEEYFEGRRTVFDLPIDRDALGGTAFQQEVWRTLEKIPFGTTISYGELARRIGNPNASRAVGLANGRNPVSIIVPCHRVIGANGSLTGYGGGMDRKRWLLHLENQRERLL